MMLKSQNSISCYNINFSCYNHVCLLSIRGQWPRTWAPAVATWYNNICGHFKWPLLLFSYFSTFIVYSFWFFSSTLFLFSSSSSSFFSSSSSSSFYSFSSSSSPSFLCFFLFFFLLFLSLYSLSYSCFYLSSPYFYILIRLCYFFSLYFLLFFFFPSLFFSFRARSRNTGCIKYFALLGIDISFLLEKLIQFWKKDWNRSWSAVFLCHQFFISALLNMPTM